jgi:Zn-dependent protease with chaperone function
MAEMEASVGAQISKGEVKEQQCPQCHAPIPVHFGYVSWCDQCGWNLQPLETNRPTNVFESAYASIGKRFSQQLFDEVLKAESLRPTLTLSKVLAYSLAALVHSFTIILVVVGIVLLLRGWSNLFAIFGGLLCLGIAWLLRPRMPKSPDEVAHKDKFPTLYKITNDVAQALGTSNVDGIVINWQFSAAYAQSGWRRKKVIFLGLPLFAILDGQEKVALLSHEVAHGVNGDPTRGLFVGTAIDSLVTWHVLLRPRQIWRSEAGIYGILLIPFSLAMLGVAYIPWLGAYALSYLLWHDSQRAEYLADALAAEASGTEAALGLLKKLHFHRTVELALQRASYQKIKIGNLFEELRRCVAEVPQRELDRINRVSQLQESRLDATHPPTVYRIGLLAARRVSEPKVILPVPDIELLEQELSAV